jgi:drug/metabolite transporter (DMT)-like permease
VVALAFLVLCACWSTTWYAIRLCLQGYPPVWGATLRFALAALLMGALVAFLRRQRAGLRPGLAGPAALGEEGRGLHLVFLGAGVANGLGYACVYLAERTISGGTAAVISATSPFFTAVAARLLGLEPFLARRLIGAVLGFAGVTIMMSEGLSRSGAHLSAMLLVTLASAVLWPLHGALLKRHACGVHPMLSCTYLLGYTALTLFVLSVTRGEPMPRIAQLPAVAHLGLFYLAVVGSVIAWTVYLWLLQRLDLTVLATMGLIQPVLALGLDWFAGDLGQLRLRGLFGAALVILGVALAVLRSGGLRVAVRRPAAELQAGVRPI